ncbi:zinc finger protein 593 homolog isoform X2 [Vespa crabro]|uniref:zinc finger protein 593 homolog isoform X2 n=1 Tax=Vespa crabro TaxID=7445 RepID=UPI001F031AA8|nr:zinc finger protein 593 homolog isoform X2 [Vespa crabro]
MLPRCVPPFFVRDSRPRGKSRLTQYFYFQNGWGPPLRSGARFELTLKNVVRGATHCTILPPSTGLIFFSICNFFNEICLRLELDKEMTYKRKKYHRGDTHLKKGWKTKRRTKDLDEIDEDLKEQNVKQLLHQEVDLDKPGAAQHYCVHCARYFINQTALHSHFTTKVHKRRLKALELEPYSIEESERAAGKGSYIAPQKREIETLTVDNDTDTISQSNLEKMDS